MVDTLSEDARQIRRVRGTPTSHYCVTGPTKLSNDTTLTTNQLPLNIYSLKWWHLVPDVGTTDHSLSFISWLQFPSVCSVLYPLMRCGSASHNNAQIRYNPCRGVGITPHFVSVEIENVMRSASVDIRANPRVVAACPRSIAYCTNQNSQKDDSGKVVMAGDKIEGAYFSTQESEK